MREMKDLTPPEIVRELDRYIIGQQAAKRAVAVALRNRMRRMRLPEALRTEVTPKNILMIGPTGVGKTEIARRMAQLANAPFLKVEVTKFTQVGYVGRDVDTIIRDLIDTALAMAQQDKENEVREQAEERAQERILTYLLTPRTAREIVATLDGTTLLPVEEQPQQSEALEMAASAAPRGKGQRASAKTTALATAGGATGTIQVAPARRESARIRTARKKRIAEALANQQLEERMIDIELEPDDSLGSMIEYMTTIGPDDSGEIMQEFLTPSFTTGRKRTRRVSVRDARQLLVREEAMKLVDMEQVIEDATNRVEQNGIVFLDELDKIVGSKVETGPDVSGEGVQRDLLPIVEGSTVMTRYGPVKTDHILWIAAGAFHKNKPSDLIPELQGRFPLRVELDSLTMNDFKLILSQPEHSLTKQYQYLLSTEDIALRFTDSGIEAMARYAAQMNERMENIGARRLHTIIEKVLEDLSYNAGDFVGQEVVVDDVFVQARIGNIIKNEDLSKYIL